MTPPELPVMPNFGGKQLCKGDQVLVRGARPPAHSLLARTQVVGPEKGRLCAREEEEEEEGFAHTHQLRGVVVDPVHCPGRALNGAGHGQSNYLRGDRGR